MTRREPVWIGTWPERAEQPRLGGEASADVAVVGGGIVGVTTALLLAEAGARVVLLEAGRLAGGVSGHTTAKVTSQHGFLYTTLRSRFGAEAARAYASSNEAALSWIAGRVERDGIDCDFRRQPAYAYVTRESSRSKVEREVAAATEAGLPASLVETTPLPYAVEAAVRFEDQAEFHIRKYLLALADQLPARGCRVYERTRVLGVEEGPRCRLKTADGAVMADRVVIASHYPFLDRSLAFARIHAERSYAIACRIDGRPPPGMHISGDGPTRSIRAVPVEGEELLLVGGEGHRTGEGGDTEERYLRLEDFAREHWKLRSVEYRWSSQDNVTIDRLPYIGDLAPRSNRVLMATGFAKWGMTGGTVAALILADRLAGRHNPWAELYDPNRLRQLICTAKLAVENARVGLHFFGDRVRKPGVRRIDDLSPGEGDIVRSGVEKVAAYRREDGTLLAVSSRCTHLGCQLNWNSAERSWDCPCHGSRFDPEGHILHGPAVRDLQRKPVDQARGSRQRSKPTN